MNKSPDVVVIGAGVAGLSAGQALWLVRQYSPSTRLLFVRCYTADAPDSEIPVTYPGWRY